MKRFLLPTLTIIILAGLLAGAPAAHAQDAARLTAAVDRNNLTTDETLMLTLTLYTPDGSMPKLTLPSLDQFRVIGSSQSLQTSIINGATSAQAVYTFQLQPIGVGNFTIPGLSLDWNGQLLSTDPIPVAVSQGSGAPNNSAPPVAQPQGGITQPGSSANRNGDHDLFVEAVVDKQSLYVGEMVKFNLRLYNNVMSFGQPNYDAPQFVGFWHPQKPDVRQYSVTGNDGTPYDVTELTTWLFPTTPGQATIDPATVSMPGGFLHTRLTGAEQSNLNRGQAAARGGAGRFQRGSRPV